MQAVDTFSAVTAHRQGNDAYSSVTLMNDDRVVFAPRDAKYVGVYEPRNDSFGAVAAHNESNLAYEGATLMNDGRVVFTPFNAKYVSVFEPINNTLSAVAAHNEFTPAYDGAALMGDGRVVFAPYNASYVGVFDPTDDSFIAAAKHGQGDYAYAGVALMNDGRVVFAPYNASYVGVFDPTDDSFSPVAATNQRKLSYVQATRVNDGRVVFTPYEATHVGVFDPTDSSFSSKSAHKQGSRAYIGTTLMNDGRVVFAPAAADSVGVFNPSNDSFSAVPTLREEKDPSFLDATLMNDGRVVFPPFAASNMGIFDPSYDSFTSVAADNLSIPAYRDGALMRDGRVAFAPLDADHVGIFAPNSSLTFSHVRSFGGVDGDESISYSLRGDTLALDPSGEIVIVRSRDGLLAIHEYASLNRSPYVDTVLSVEDPTAAAASVKPDGSTLAVLSNGTLEFFDKTSGSWEEAPRARVDVNICANSRRPLLEWHPTNASVALGCRLAVESNVTVIAHDTPSGVTTDEISIELPRSATFSPDGTRLVISGHESNLTFVDWPSLNVTSTVSIPPYDGSDFDSLLAEWSPTDKSVIAIAGIDYWHDEYHSLLLEISDYHNELQISATHRLSFSSSYTPAFSPDGKYIAFVNRDRKIEMVNASSSKIFKTLDARGVEFVNETYPNTADTVAFSPGGKYLLNGDAKGFEVRSLTSLPSQQDGESSTNNTDTEPPATISPPSAEVSLPPSTPPLAPPSVPATEAVCDKSAEAQLELHFRKSQYAQTLPNTTANNALTVTLSSNVSDAEEIVVDYDDAVEQTMLYRCVSASSATITLGKNTSSGGNEDGWNGILLYVSKVSNDGLQNRQCTLLQNRTLLDAQKVAAFNIYASNCSVESMLETCDATPLDIEIGPPDTGMGVMSLALAPPDSSLPQQSVSITTSLYQDVFGATLRRCVNLAVSEARLFLHGSTGITINVTYDENCHLLQRTNLRPLSLYGITRLDTDLTRCSMPKDPFVKLEEMHSTNFAALKSNVTETNNSVARLMNRSTDTNESVILLQEDIRKAQNQLVNLQRNLSSTKSELDRLSFDVQAVNASSVEKEGVQARIDDLENSTASIGSNIAAIDRKVSYLLNLTRNEIGSNITA